MGVEWDMACVGCRSFAWLGSMKPFKWSGFQVGNGPFTELLSLHAGPECGLIVTSDALAFEVPWEHDSDACGFREDLRSRWCWESIRHDSTPPAMICAACQAVLALPATPDGASLRESGYRASPGAPAPLIVGRYLWFCGERCREVYGEGPGRVWRPCPDALVPRRITVRCLRCDAAHSLGAPEPAEDEALAFAEWLCEHVYDPPSRTDVDDPAGCRLQATVDLLAPGGP